MTSDPTILCKRCGFANIPGDQFCGSCGAFLEWEGQPTGPAPAETATAATAPISSALDDTAPTTWAAPTPAPVVAAPAPEAGLLRCPSCGIANPPTRTFCQSCGTTLAAASPVQEVSAEQIAAAVAATPRPATSPVPAAGARPKAGDKPAGKGGIPGWVFAVGALGLLVGVVAVGASLLLRGAPPASVATSGPGGPSVAPASAPASGDASGAPASGQPPAAGDPVELVLTGATASSVIGDRAKFQPEKAIDGDITTSWQEGKAKEKGQWIEVAFDAARADTLVIRNGYQASEALYLGNRRLKDVEISIGDGSPVEVRLKDTMKAQRFDLGGVSGITSVRITILTTYAPRKTSVAGTPFDDTAVSEISVIGIPGG